jgi:mRNA-degrading endonuclease toxin of MazEF toxin-antitoxin module
MNVCRGDAAPLAVGAPSAGANSVALPDQLRAVDRNKLAKRIGPMGPDDLAAVEQAVKQVFGLL